MYLTRPALILILLTTFLLGLPQSQAQKVLRIDKRGSLKTKKFYRGDILTFQLYGDEDWYEEEIVDILTEINSIRTANRVISADSIRTIRTFDKRATGRGLERTFQVFSAAWALFALGGSLGGYELQPVDAIMPASSLLLGRIFYWIFKQKTYRFDRKYRILLLDLNPFPLESRPANP